MQFASYEGGCMFYLEHRGEKQGKKKGLEDTKFLQVSGVVQAA